MDFSFENRSISGALWYQCIYSYDIVHIYKDKSLSFSRVDFDYAEQICGKESYKM